MEKRGELPKGTFARFVRETRGGYKSLPSSAGYNPNQELLDFEAGFDDIAKVIGGGGKDVTGILGKLSPDLKNDVTKLAQSGANLKSIAGMLPKGMDVQSLLKQSGLDLNLDSMLKQSGISIPGGYGNIAQGVLKIGQNLLSGNLDAGDIALEAVSTVKSVIGQIGGPGNQLSDAAAGVVTDALGITGVGSQIGSTAGAGAGLIFGPVGSAVGDFVGSVLGGAGEAAMSALGVGAKAARLEREKGRKKSDYAILANLKKTVGDAGIYKLFMKGDLVVYLGIPGAQHNSEKHWFAVTNGKLKEIPYSEVLARQKRNPKLVLLAGVGSSRDLLNMIQKYEVGLYKKRQGAAVKLNAKIRDDIEAKLKARERLAKALTVAAKIHKGEPIKRKATAAKAVKVPANKPAFVAKPSPELHDDHVILAKMLSDVGGRLVGIEQKLDSSVVLPQSYINLLGGKDALRRMGAR